MKTELAYLSYRKKIEIPWLNRDKFTSVNSSIMITTLMNESSAPEHLLKILFCANQDVSQFVDAERADWISQ